MLGIRRLEDDIKDDVYTINSYGQLIAFVKFQNKKMEVIPLIDNLCKDYYLKIFKYFNLKFSADFDQTKVFSHIYKYDSIKFCSFGYNNDNSEKINEINSFESEYFINHRKWHEYNDFNYLLMILYKSLSIINVDSFINPDDKKVYSKLIKYYNKIFISYNHQEFKNIITKLNKFKTIKSEYLKEILSLLIDIVIEYKKLLIDIKLAYISNMIDNNFTNIHNLPIVKYVYNNHSESINQLVIPI